VRIFPLYWLALLVTPLFMPDYFELKEWSLKTIGIFLGLPFIKAPGIFWFVTAIIQCYLLAPFLYFLLSKLKAARFTVFNISAMTISVMLTLAYIYGSQHYVHFPNLEVLIYRDIFFEHISLFSLGMLAAMLLSEYGDKLVNRAGLAGSLLLFGLMFVINSDQNTLFKYSQVVLAPFFVTGAAAACLFTVVVAPPLPFGRVLSLVGGYSYPLYLFHRAFYAFLNHVGIIHDQSLTSIFYTLALLPLFLACCILLEKSLVWARIKTD
jgi:peptidoglycan/LPS O-acetylase OafA/YrhL